MHPLAPKFQLHEISLSCCGDGGSFPQFLYHQHDLRYVDLSNIKLIGEFPNWLLENNTKLETVVLANNSLLGHFQLPFLSHLHLSHLDISINSFCGNISIDIGAKLPSLTFLNMSKNSFGGSIPASVGDMNFLQYLDLSNNKLDGGLPEHLAMGCSSLSALILSNNSLQGQIFSANFSLTNLRELQVDGNHFSGSIPDCLSNCSDLSISDVSNNQLFDEIPRWMENLSSLSILDLSNNTIFGGIPKWMGNMSSLETIVMANDHLEGPIPMEFCQLNLNLKFLDLSVNNISGSLPSCFNPLRISHVHLSKNKLQGPLANAFRNSSNLVILDLSNNHLSGNIPNWIGKLSQLSYLLLNNNYFEGRIPLQLCKLSHLSLIDLSHNNLFGIIPPCLKVTTLNNISEDHVRYVGAVDAIAPSSSFSAEEPIEFTTKNISYPYKGKILTYLSGIDLSYNKLTGEIPHDVKNFLNIIVLNLAHNNLTGSIPLEFSNLRQIESLDLSYNNLTGKIPPQLAELHFLAYFNVSYNNLSGKTLETGQFATFDENSYLGNLFLCGALLRNNCSAIERTSIDNSEDDGSIDMDVFYVSFIVSYIIVLLGIAVVLYINPYWRRVWFYHIEMGITSSYYFVVDNLPGGFRC
ncbi:PREDICTED: probable LRR receptor-like serine/threonine-protein kinase At4g36180 [Theobroma cacao]|uniref:Probable LRR receptor-like serine/threonine-protein kinase At4g36180 n=1 Tax=Theobroma cacao TaxID=3641 RepID=A0AB32X3X8_THECC|nr:PREDICTED: probable LRR receptor-like serine/threonine-protein kinase At4g36180 [Theobroma cacao]